MDRRGESAPFFSCSLVSVVSLLMLVNPVIYTLFFYKKLCDSDRANSFLNFEAFWGLKISYEFLIFSYFSYLCDENEDLGW